jgi:hypothetical protein
MFAQGTICKMVAQCTQQGKSIDEAIDLARTDRTGHGFGSPVAPGRFFFVVATLMSW